MPIQGITDSLSATGLINASMNLAGRGRVDSFGKKIAMQNAMAEGEEKLVGADAEPASGAACPRIEPNMSRGCGGQRRPAGSHIRHPRGCRGLDPRG